MDSKLITPSAQNKMADLALKAAIFNLICWLIAAVPNVLLSSRSIILLLTIPLSAGIALVAGMGGVLKVKTLGTGGWQSLTGVMIGVLNILLIIVSLIGIYAMVNAPF
jgi:hypothetical protein